MPRNNSELDNKQLELSNIVFNYFDFYDSNATFDSDSKYKFVYATHVLNHVLKTRSRIIVHNDKLKQSKSTIETYVKLIIFDINYF